MREYQILLALYSCGTWVRRSQVAAVFGRLWSSHWNDCLYSLIERGLVVQAERASTKSLYVSLTDTGRKYIENHIRSVKDEVYTEV